MGNRRARTIFPVKDNHIFGIQILKDGYGQRTLAYHHNRRMHDGTRYTGPAKH